MYTLKNLELDGITSEDVLQAIKNSQEEHPKIKINGYIITLNRFITANFNEITGEDFASIFLNKITSVSNLQELVYKASEITKEPVSEINDDIISGAINFLMSEYMESHNIF